MRFPSRLQVLPPRIRQEHPVKPACLQVQPHSVSPGLLFSASMRSRATHIFFRGNVPATGQPKITGPLRRLWRRQFAPCTSLRERSGEGRAREEECLPSPEVFAGLGRRRSACDWMGQNYPEKEPGRHIVTIEDREMIGE